MQIKKKFLIKIIKIEIEKKRLNDSIQDNSNNMQKLKPKRIQSYTFKKE